MSADADCDLGMALPRNETQKKRYPYCAKDLTRLMAIFVDGEEISLIGTGADELCSGRAVVASIFERNFSDASATLFEWQWKDIALHCNAATVALILNIHRVIEDENLVVPVR